MTVPPQSIRPALAKVSKGLGEPMPGLDIKELGEEGLLQVRGW